MTNRYFTLWAFAPLLLSACMAWEHEVERGGYRFHTYRLSDSGVHIGKLSTPATISGFTCQHSEWIHLKPDWTLEACFLAEPYDMEHFTIPAGSWVRPSPDRIMAAFETNTPCQGYVCSGSGGTKGIQTTFYHSGKLRAFFPPHDVDIGGVTCKASLLVNVQLHEDGGLRGCRSARKGVYRDRSYKKGAQIKLDADGDWLD